ncbi:MAG: DUF1353 domain-containing protein [Gammaproteobacteria bacterium]
MTRIYLSCAPFEPNTWVLEKPYARQTAVGLLEVPAGFRTDLASTPRTLWRLFPKHGPWFGAAVVHDWLYRTHPAVISDRWTADCVFRQLLRADGVTRGTAWSMFKVVRAYGASAWSAAA